MWGDYFRDLKENFDKLGEDIVKNIRTLVFYDSQLKGLHSLILSRTTETDAELIDKLKDQLEYILFRSNTHSQLL